MLGKIIFCSVLCLFLAQVSLAQSVETGNAQHEFYRSGKELAVAKRNEQCQLHLSELRESLVTLGHITVALVVAPLLPLWFGTCVIASGFDVDQCGRSLIYILYLYAQAIGGIPDNARRAIKGIVDAIRTCLTL